MLWIFLLFCLSPWLGKMLSLCMNRFSLNNGDTTTNNGEMLTMWKMAGHASGSWGQWQQWVRERPSLIWRQWRWWGWLWRRWRGWRWWISQWWWCCWQWWLQKWKRWRKVILVTKKVVLRYHYMHQEGDRIIMVAVGLVMVLLWSNIIMIK